MHPGDEGGDVRLRKEKCVENREEENESRLLLHGDQALRGERI
jgi:hypothetical protein